MTGGGIAEGLNRAMKQIDSTGWESVSNPIPLWPAMREAGMGERRGWRLEGAPAHAAAIVRPRSVT